MHTMKRGKGEDRLWTVGFFEPHADGDGTWHQWVPIRDFTTQDSAECYVNYLNGGSGNMFVEPTA